MNHHVCINTIRVDSLCDMCSECDLKHHEVIIVTMQLQNMIYANCAVMDVK